MKMKKSDLMVAIVALMAVGIFFLYMKIISPTKASNEILEKTHTTLSAESADIANRSSSSTLTSAKRKLTEAKGSAMEISGSTLSGTNYARIQQKTGNNLRQYMNVTSETWGKSLLKATNESFTDAKGKNATLRIQRTTLSFTVELASLDPTAAENEFNELLVMLIDDFNYLILESYTYEAPVGTTKGSVSFNTTVIVLAADLEEYRVGICPHVLEDGTACGGYNEFTDSKCYKCKKLIDNCPVCNTMLVYDEQENTVICTNTACNTPLKKCLICGEYTRQSESVCDKCGQNQSEE